VLAKVVCRLIRLNGSSLALSGPERKAQRPFSRQDHCSDSFLRTHRYLLTQNRISTAGQLCFLQTAQRKRSITDDRSRKISSTATTAIQNIRLGSQAAVVPHTGLGRLSMSEMVASATTRSTALRPQQTRCLFIAFEEGRRGNGLFRRRICRRPNPQFTAFFTSRRSLPFRPLSLMWRF
jgi:hypothetical protein